MLSNPESSLALPSSSLSHQQEGKEQQQEQQVKISDNAMRHLFSLNYTSNETYNLNYILQIIHIGKSESSYSNSNKYIYSATLSDSTHKYNGFIFISESKEINMSVSNLINILKVSPIMTGTKPKLTFVVKKYEYINNKMPIINSLLIIDNKGRTLFDKKKEEDEVVPDEDKVNLITNEIKDYTPLKQLSTFSKEFKVFVGVISKTEKKYYNSSQGNPGCLFSFIVIDVQKTEMEVTCFNKIVDKFFDKIIVNHTYEIADGSVRRAQKNYNTYLNTDYKIILEANSTVIEKEDIEKSIKLPSNKNTPIKDVATLPLYSLVNVLCIVIEEGERIMKKTKSGERPMRIISVADASKCKIELTLWGNFTHQPLTKGQILQLNSVKIGDFNGRNISTVNESHIAVNPNNQEANELRSAISAFNGDFNDLSIENNSKSIMREMNELSSSGTANIKIEFINEVLESIDEVVETNNLTRIKATITRIVHNEKNFYSGCPNKDCKKKLTRDFNEWICLSCNKKYSKPTFYFTLSLRIKDCSCDHWLDVFGKTAENLLKLTAEEYKDALYDKESSKLKVISKEIEFKDFIFVIKPKIQMFNSTIKKKLQVYKIDPVNQREDARRLIADIKNSLNK